MLYMVTFTINIPQMLAYMPYMDTMGFDSCRFSVEVYILTELITGGELHGAIREIPTVLSRCGW